ncbi:MAG: O-methyltransferase [Bacteroidaceae bacterium]|nr:O-methyltransferase [Bacteroidaceae bacterium]
MSLDDYILAHIDPEPEYLHRLWRATNLHLNYPRMASGHLQGRLLRMLVHMIRPQTVLEIGTFTGYSTLCMASALAPGAIIHTIEINDEQEDFTRPWLENSPWADHIRFHIGDALDLISHNSLDSNSFDLVFIDADKRHYVDYYRAVLPKVAPGGFILADNTLWDGHVVDDIGLEATNGKDAQTLGIMAFNELVAKDSGVERVILPLRDGLTIIRKLPE